MPVRGVFVIFFIYMLKSKERPVRVFIGEHLSLRGREEKVTVFRLVRIVWLQFWVDRGPVKSRSVPDPPKTEVKAGRGVQENTRQYREAKEANVIRQVFLTNISANFLNVTVGDRPVGLVHWRLLAVISLRSRRQVVFVEK